MSRLLLALCLCASAARAAGPADVFLPQDPSRGWRVFTQKGCPECHQIRGEGGTYGPDLGLKVFALDRYQIAGAMWNHSPMMTAKMRELGIVRPVFEDDEMSDLIAFLYFLNYFDEPGDARRGEALFGEKGCAGCHAVGDSGGDKGPALDEILDYPFPVAIAQSMWNHGPDMVAMMRSEGVPVPTFAGREMIDLFAYVRTVSSAARRRAYTSPGDPRRGKELFAAKGCATCHMDAGTAPDLRRIGAQYSITQIAGLMWNHAVEMWEQMQAAGLRQPLFEDDEMADTIAYVYSLRFAGRPGDSGHGRELFTEKRCASCHPLGGRGSGTVGPDLEAVGDAPLAVARMMWNHARDMEPEMAERQLSWPRFEGQEMADLITYLANNRTD